MIRKIIIWILVCFLSAVAGSYLAKTYVRAPSDLLISPLGSIINIQNRAVDLPEDIDEKLLEEINKLRKEEKLKELKINAEMSKAAKARLSVIDTFGDYTGTESGVTREKSLEAVAYKPSIVGDVYLYLVSEEADINKLLTKDEIDAKTILHPQFTEIGIAKIVSEESAQIYIIFSSKQARSVSTPAALPTSRPKVAWGGPELWEAVNKRRVEFGVGQLTRKDELCTIASIRLNQLLDQGKLDGHAGFKAVLDRSDLKWISEKYNISEYLAQGYQTPEETVKGWENTLGHRSLLTGGEFVWGCIYAQNTFAVAITAY